MREKHLYVVLDKKAKALLGPIMHDYNEVNITRQVIEAVNKPDTLIGRSPEDFCILCLGSIDEETGQFYDTDDSPKVIAEALALRAFQD